MRKTTYQVPAFCCALSLVPVDPAAAQVAATAVRQAATRARVEEPVRRIKITPFAELTDETNVLRLPINGTIPNARGHDNRFSPGVTVDVLVPTGGVQLFATGTLAYDFYRRYKGLNRERIALDGGASAPVSGQCRATAAVSWLRQQSDVADLRLITSTTFRNTEDRLAPRVSINCGQRVGLVSGLSYEHARVTNSNPFFRFGDFDVDTIGAQVGLARPTLGQVSIFSNYSRGLYRYRFTPSGSRERVESVGVGLRVERQFGIFRGYAQGGITHVNDNQPGVRSFTGPTYALGIDARIGARTNAHLGIARAIQQSNLLGVSYSVTDAADARVDYGLNSYASVFGAVTLSNNRYDRSPLLGIGSNRFNDRLSSYTAGISLIAARRLAVDLSATLLRRRGDAAIFDYNSRVLGVRLRLR